MKFWSAIKEAYRLIFDYPRLVLDETDYDRYWKAKRGENFGYLNSFQRARADWVLSRIQDRSSIVDVGCGDGAVLLYLRSKKNLDIVGADLAPEGLAFLSSKGIRTIELDLSNIPQISSLPDADHVLLFEVLEHVQNSEKILKSLFAKAKRSIFFSVPNSGYFAYRLRLLFGRSTMQWRVHPGEHVRFWTYKDIVWWLRELGYLTRSTIFLYEGIPILNKLFPSLFAMGMIIEVVKPPSPS